MTEETLFAAVLEQAPADRPRFLQEACGADVALLQRLQALLAAHEKAVGILDQPAKPSGAPEATTGYVPSRDPVGTILAGRYKLLEQIGEGGMGTVWVAEQTQPVRRKVALKLIKAGMDSKTVLARFEAERQALALMDHPNIAKVLDGGTTEEGRPFFVMEYVKGVPLTHYCDDARLTVEERLGLFVPVCQAVQHAHQKGIVHRDLKPSNVLVCLYDGKPVPKVIDFGLAKAMQQPLTEHTLHTAHGIMMGTPLYMSPEQAELNNLDVDTRTDVYSLGVILYELLTGTTPLEKQRFKEAAWQEMLRLIKEEEPPRPSLRLSSGVTSPSVAAQRRLEPVKLSRLLKGELDWIVMKALEKDRGRRYGTPANFAEDVERYLRRDVVLARPPSAAYRLRKFVQRNRAAVLTAAAFLLLLTAGLIVSVWQAVVATRAERTALALKEESDKARADESAARKRAELQAFAVQFQELTSRYNEAVIASYPPDEEQIRDAFLGLAQLLPVVPEHAPAWRDHLVLTVLLAGRQVSPPMDLPDRRGFDVEQAAVSSDGRRIVTVTNDGSLQVRDYPSLASRCLLSGTGIHPAEVGFLAGDRAVWAIAGNQVRLWDAATGQPVGQPLAHPGRVYSLAASSADGTRLVTKSQPSPEAPETPTQNNLPHLWDARTAKRIAVLAGPKPYVNAVAFHPDGSQAVAGGYEGLFVWSAQDGKLLRQIGGFDKPVKGLAFSPSGRVLAACTASHVYWFQTQDWSRDPVATEIGRTHADELRTAWAAGSEELVSVHDTLDSFFVGGIRENLGARRGGAALLGFAPHAVRGSLVLAHNGDVHELGSGRRILPTKGRKYPDEARLFATEDRWLQTPDGLIDLAVDRPLLQSAGGRRVGCGGVGWAWAVRHYCDYGWLDATYRFWQLPERADTIPTDDLALWAEVLARGELGGDGRFRAFDEAEWESRRRQLAAKAPSAGPFRLPGFDVTDRLYWLRNVATRKGVQLDRLIAEEPTFRNYLLRARWRSESRDFAGSLADQLAAGKMTGPTFWERFTKETDAHLLGMQADRPRSEYQVLLDWADRRLAAGVGRDNYRGLALYRLERFADAVKQLESFKIGENGEDATEVLVRAMARKRLGQPAAAQEDYKAVKTQIQKWQHPGLNAHHPGELLAEAEKLFGP